ncbi:hypothetical protein AXX17_AT2G01050 [Arabidopsis thaliana]|uniref:F-box domain-containing protein n=2 Tax=Arabidopsis TaxID=3701 RepID=A0A178W0L1_ARATH|nr:hypothetical protein AXX17_AT2G01050 [Arabidopsis thaliana]
MKERHGSYYEMIKPHQERREQRTGRMFDATYVGDGAHDVCDKICFFMVMMVTTSYILDNPTSGVMSGKTSSRGQQDEISGEKHEPTPTKEIKRRRKEFEKIHIPNEIVEEILVRLPVKSLTRFQTVSKHWRTLITSKYFGKRHMALEKSKGCKLLFVCDDFVDRAEDTLFLKTVALEKTSVSEGDEQDFEFEGYKGFLDISESCDGLVCFYDTTRAVEVMNPTTTMFIELPLLRIQQLCIYKPNPEVELEPVQDPNPVLDPVMTCSQIGVGKDSVSGSYKLVWMYNTSPATPPTCEVLDLDGKKWRFVNTTSLDHHQILCDQRPVFANGSLYWLTGDEEGYATTQTKLIVLDLHTEMFQVIQTPPFITRDASGDKIGLCNLDGRLCISELKKDCKQEF